MAWHRVRAQLEELMGEEILQVDTREVIKAIGKNVCELHDAFNRIAGPVELGLPTEEQLAVARKHVDWEDRSRPPLHRRGRTRPRLDEFQ